VHKLSTGYTYAPKECKVIHRLIHRNPLVIHRISTGFPQVRLGNTLEKTKEYVSL